MAIMNRGSITNSSPNQGGRSASITSRRTPTGFVNSDRLISQNKNALETGVEDLEKRSGELNKDVTDAASGIKQVNPETGLMSVTEIIDAAKKSGSGDKQAAESLREFFAKETQKENNIDFNPLIKKSSESFAQNPMTSSGLYGNVLDNALGQMQFGGRVNSAKSSVQSSIDSGMKAQDKANQGIKNFNDVTLPDAIKKRDKIMSSEDGSESLSGILKGIKNRYTNEDVIESGQSRQYNDWDDDGILNNSHLNDKDTAMNLGVYKTLAPYMSSLGFSEKDVAPDNLLKQKEGKLFVPEPGVQYDYRTGEPTTKYDKEEEKRLKADLKQNRY